MKEVEQERQQQQQQQQRRPVASPFTFQPALLLADLVNIALETCADAFDRFEEAVAAVAQLRPEHRQTLLEGIGQLYECASGSLDQAATNFQRLAEATMLRVPMELYLEQAASVPLAAVAPEEEEALDNELRELRRQMEETKQGTLRLRQELRELNRDLASAGDPSSLDPLSGALATQRGALLEDAASIGGALLRLGPLLAKAREALEARDHAGGAKAGPSGTDAVAGAQRRVAAAQRDTGASADQLQSLHSSLTS